MKRLLILAAAVALASLQVAYAQEKKEAVPPDDPKLPRVLIIGDSISQEIMAPLRTLLKDKANVHHNPGNANDTKNGVAKLKDWLGAGKWDVVHFNFGLNDIKRSSGSLQVSLPDYEKNLRALLKELKPTGAKIIWCNTTPAPEGKLYHLRRNEDVIAYNAAAKKIMEENGVPINDLYAYTLPHLKDWQIPVNVHFTPAGSAKLAEKVAQEILKALQ